MTPVALFVRVSTTRQDYQRQIDDLTAVAQKEGWQIVQVIEEIESVSKTPLRNRPPALALLELAESGRIQKILVWEVTRLSRRPADVHVMLERITEAGVSVYIHNHRMETIVDGRRNPVASILIAIFAELGREDTEEKSSRVKSGMAHAKRKGKHIGRAKGSTEDKETVLKKYKQIVKLLRKETYKLAEIARLTDTSINTVKKVKNLLT